MVRVASPPDYASILTPNETGLSEPGPIFGSVSSGLAVGRFRERPDRRSRSAELPLRPIRSGCGMRIGFRAGPADSQS